MYEVRMYQPARQVALPHGTRSNNCWTVQRVPRCYSWGYEVLTDDCCCYCLVCLSNPGIYPMHVKSLSWWCTILCRSLDTFFWLKKWLCSGTADPLAHFDGNSSLLSSPGIERRFRQVFPDFCVVQTFLCLFGLNIANSSSSTIECCFPLTVWPGTTKPKLNSSWVLMYPRSSTFCFKSLFISLALSYLQSTSHLSTTNLPLWPYWRLSTNCGSHHWH